MPGPKPEKGKGAITPKSTTTTTITYDSFLKYFLDYSHSNFILKNTVLAPFFTNQKIEENAKNLQKDLLEKATISLDEIQTMWASQISIDTSIEKREVILKVIKFLFEIEENTQENKENKESNDKNAIKRIVILKFIYDNFNFNGSRKIDNSTNFNKDIILILKALFPASHSKKLAAGKTDQEIFTLIDNATKNWFLPAFNASTKATAFFKYIADALYFLTNKTEEGKYIDISRLKIEEEEKNSELTKLRDSEYYINRIKNIQFEASMFTAKAKRVSEDRENLPKLVSSLTAATKENAIKAAFIEYFKLISKHLPVKEIEEKFIHFTDLSSQFNQPSKIFSKFFNDTDVIKLFLAKQILFIKKDAIPLLEKSILTANGRLKKTKFTNGLERFLSEQKEIENKKKKQSKGSKKKSLSIDDRLKNFIHDNTGSLASTSNSIPRINLSELKTHHRSRNPDKPWGTGLSARVREKARIKASSTTSNSSALTSLKFDQERLRKKAEKNIPPPIQRGCAKNDNDNEPDCSTPAPSPTKMTNGS